MARDAAPLLERWRARHPEDASTTDDVVLRRVQAKFPGDFDDVTLGAKPHPFTLVDRATSAMTQTEGALFGAANSVMFGLPEMAFNKLGVEPPQGPGRTVGDIAGFLMGPAKAAGGVARVAGKGLTAATRPLPGFIRGALTGSRAPLRGALLGGVEGATAGALTPAETGQERIGRAALFAPVGTALGTVAPLTRAAFSARSVFRSGARARRFSELTRGRAKGRLERGEAEALRSLETSKTLRLKELDATKARLQGLLQTQGREAAQTLQQEVPGYLEAARQGYAKVVQEGFERLSTAAPLSQKAVEESLGTLAKRFPTRTQDLLTRLFPGGATTTDARRAYDVIRRHGVSHGEAGLFADDATNAVITTIEKTAGTDAFSRAREFWSQYAPFRDRLVRFARPFRGASLEAPRVAQGLRAAAGKTGETFVGEIENRLGVPLTEALRATTAKLTRAEQAQLLTKLNAQGLGKQIRETTQFAVQRQGQKLSRTLFRREEKSAVGRGIATTAIGAGGYVLLYRLYGALLDAVSGGRTR